MPVVIQKRAPAHKEESALQNPMLAAEAELGKIHYPIYGLPKHNGVRGVNQNGSLFMRSLKPAPNAYTRSLFSLPECSGFEGELVVGQFNDEEVFTASTSGVMSVDGKPDVVWYIFDMMHPTLKFSQRIERVTKLVQDLDNPRIKAIPYVVLHSDAEVVAYCNKCLSEGYEGIVLRAPNAIYKNGRSTQGENGFMRYCPWFRSEAVVLAISEGQINLNPSELNELGYKKKSSHKDNKVGSGRAGSMRVRDIKTGLEFNMPIPTVKLQKEMLENPHLYLQTLAHYKFKPPVKIGGKPRFPQLEGFRDTRDMS